MIFELEGQRYSYFNKDGRFLKSQRMGGRIYHPYIGLSTGDYIARKIIFEKDKTIFIHGVFNQESRLKITFDKNESGPYQRYNQADPDARSLAPQAPEVAVSPRHEGA